MFSLTGSPHSEDSRRLFAAMKRGRSLLLLLSLVALVSAGLLGLIISSHSGDRALSNGTGAAGPAAQALTAGSVSQAAQAVAQSSAEHGRSALPAQRAEAYNNLPLSFEANEGQTDARVRFYSRGRGYGLFLTPTEAVLALRDSAPAKAEGEAEDRTGRIQSRARRVAQTAVLRMQLKGASREPSVKGLDELPGKVNYFVGRSPENWRTGIRTYARVSYESVYPGIDLVYYGRQRQLEYDFILAPGADARSIRLGFQGTLRPVVDEQGNLVLHPRSGGGDVSFHKPVVYQEVAGVRREVSARYVLNKGSEVGFEVGDYDHQKPLVIDPVLAYSTFYGGSSFDDAHAIAVDAEGNAYVTGQTFSSDFPIVGGVQSTYHNGADNVEAFVLKLNAAGSAALYSTYLGGQQGSSLGYSIAVDAGGNAYVVGTTDSTDFPTVNALQSSPNGNDDGFAAKLNPSGSQLLYSTYLGGSGPDNPRGVAVDAGGNAYVAGNTNSTDFPTTDALKRARLHYNTVMKSGNGGQLWTDSGKGINAYATNYLLVDPASPSTVYAATDNGVFKSADSGANWTGVSQNQIPRMVNRLAINPVSTSTIYAATSGGVYKSTDGGVNWTGSGLAGSSVKLLVIDPLNPSILYAALTDRPGVLKSVDAGASWTTYSNVVSQGGVVNALAIDPSNTSTIYAATSGGVYKSTDGGVNWAVSNSGSGAIIDLVVDKNAPSTLYFTTNNGLYKSTDRGASWVRLVPINFLFTWLAIDPSNSSTVYAGTRSSGVLKSTNGWSSWERINNGLVIFITQGMAIDPSNPSTLYLASYTDAEVFVTKLSPAGNSLVYSTYLGGNGSDFASGVAIDGSGDAFVTGFTASPDFPLANAYQGTLKDSSGDAFVAKLNPAGTALLYSTYLGGGRKDSGNGIAVDASGNAYVAGYTYSSDFPTVNAFQSTGTNGRSPDGFVTKLNASGAPLYSTYLGGLYDDYANAIAVDASGNAYITGDTDSLDFPVLGGFQRGAVSNDSDAFVTRLNAAGELSYSSYLGGKNGDDIGNSIAVDAGGSIYLAGTTYASDFPTVHALDSALSGGQDAFITKFSPVDDLAVSMTGSPGMVNYGDNVTYKLTVINSEAPSTGVTLTDNLPQGATLVSASASQGSCSGTGPIICSLGNMSAGSSATLTIVIKPPATNNITNTASVTRNEPEQNQSNNTASVGTQVVFADISVSKSTFNESVAPGSEIVYFIKVRNLSGSIPYEITLADNLPAELTFVSCSFNICGGSGNNRTVTFSSLNVGTSNTFMMVARVNSSVAPGTVIDNTVSVSSPLPDPNPSDNTARSAVTVTSAPVRFRQNGKIATYSNRSSANPSQPSGIYAVNPDGTGESLLVNTQSSSAPAWSPDGTLLAYVRNSSELYVARADGTSSILVASDVSNDNSRLTWSPNGKRVAYVGNDLFVHIASADGTGTEPLQVSAPPAHINDLSWSPDGSAMAYSDGFNIFKSRLGGGWTNLTQDRPRNNGELARSRYPRWSPDGTRLLFEADSQNYKSIYVMNANGSGLTQLLGGSNAEAPAWSPDGAKIAYISQGSLYVAKADGTSPTQVLGNGFNNFAPDWQPLAPLPGLQFSAASYSAAENAGVAVINVTRSGDASRAASVDYATSDGTAKQRTDYTLASGTLNFAPGETSKSFNILLTDNAYVDGQRTVNLSLGNPLDAGLAQPSTAVLTITDNDTSPPTANPIDDAQFFVRQQYADFLNRAPDEGGLGYWSGEIIKCGTDPQCIHDRRVGVADAFFFETEFQQTGGYIYRIYRAALGVQPTYAQFASDRGRVVVGPGLDQSKNAFALVFAQRDSFLTLYPRTQTASQFVDALLLNIKQNSGVDLTSQRASLISLADGTDAGRAAILKQLAESQSFIDAEYNRSFVLMEYFGYLRRDPDQGGFDFWLNQVNKYPLRNVSIQHAMACSFITSAEYQTRFSSVVTHSNRECPQ